MLKAVQFNWFVNGFYHESKTYLQKFYDGNCFIIHQSKLSRESGTF